MVYDYGLRLVPLVGANWLVPAGWCGLAEVSGCQRND